MENSGLMTFRDILLLYEKEKSTERNLEQVALVVCHEVSFLVSTAFVKLLKAKNFCYA
jgi:hypothetical protein